MWSCLTTTNRGWDGYGDRGNFVASQLSGHPEGSPVRCAGNRVLRINNAKSKKSSDIILLV